MSARLHVAERVAARLIAEAEASRLPTPGAMLIVPDLTAVQLLGWCGVPRRQSPRRGRDVSDTAPWLAGALLRAYMDHDEDDLLAEALGLTAGARSDAEPQQ